MLKTNLQSIQSHLKKELTKSNRKQNSLTLIAVSKKQSVEKISKLIELGHLDFGENQLQEIETKWSLIRSRYSQIRLHFIGTIQSRKIQRIFELCDEIHSVDRIKIVQAIKALEEKYKKKKSYFIQVNTGNEPLKSGVNIDEIDQFIEETRSQYDLSIKGLMCIPPIDDNPEKHFKILKDIANKHHIKCLSMGMSNDYDVAVQNGATHVRIGTSIFGARD
tara:strand:- start:93 stop:752 length:660 start_codon:yes stop_codon:yes gene_type:complete